LKIIVNQEAMNNWLQKAKPGEKAIYYDGMLLAEREKFFASGGTPERLPEPMRVARIAWKAYLDGIVHLVQKRKGMMSYAYIAVRA
jgi:hypothetical protein